MKKVTSYIWPTTKRVLSKINGTLDITWINGKKVLDSKNANYSYGSLQRLLEYGLSHIYFDLQAEVLVLGMGGGSVLHSLRKRFKHKGKITAIELDPVVIQIAKEEFEVKTLPNISIIQQDAFFYIDDTQEKYQLIIIDLFIDRKVPDTCYSPAFWEKLHNRLSLKGSILFNAGILVEDDTPVLKLIRETTDLFTFERYDEVQGTNLLLIARKK
ncbi:fused MFS/spermidine synthase [Aquimarina sp. ERC-38]|uniref:spermidine synthase n=1 Tax=Aquimarina sp. ERC-38 TaxID=2949996 RepID=UPI002246521D|nr:fused MFS/spermidine synthase [Aquimarina sp. ERC-38]UZO79481.1 fused MFS/spermidine synthase [Aquimarina sp. ERC-38]